MNPLTRRPRYPVDYSWNWLNSFLTLLGVVFGISAFAIALTVYNNQQTTGGGGPFPPIPPSHGGGGDGKSHFLALHDNTTQQLFDSDVWTNIKYHYETFKGRNWHHNVTQDATKITSKHYGVFTFYISVQTGFDDDNDGVGDDVNTSSVNNGDDSDEKKKRVVDNHINGEHHHMRDTFCKLCRLHYDIRVVQQYGGTGPFNEVIPSFTHSNRNDQFLSKLFLVSVQVGDVFMVQFKSLCTLLVLKPLGDLDYFNSFPSSATLVIS